MAEVWSARIVGTHPGEDRFFAVKLLASHLSEREEYRDMFLAEARLSMMLSHPNIVQVYDAVAHEHDCYMVMELVSGLTLSQFQRAMKRSGETINLTIAAFIVGELLRALSYAHTAQTEAGSIIVHRDVSPQNVMVTAEGEVKLMDFGIARFASEETQGAFVKGKLQYMPPEQLRKQTRKPTVDLYAVGAILHELLDGRRFRGKLSQADLLRMVMHGEVPPLRDPTHVPTALDVVRRGLLEPEEDERIQTARKALGMLVRWPEYRESASDLRAQVSRFIDVNSVFHIPETTKISSVAEGSFSGVPLPAGQTGEHPAASSDAQFDSMQAAKTEPTGAEITSAEAELDLLPEVAVTREADRRKGWPFALGGVVVAAGLGAALFVFQGGNSNGGADKAPEPAAPASAPVPETTPEPEPVPEPVVVEVAPDPVPDPVEVPPDPVEVAPGPEAGDPQPTTAPEQPVELVPVAFVANECFFVYVRVKGRALTLEPRSRIQLPAGSHRVQLRQSEDDKWQTAGRIVLDVGSSYRVEMTKPAGLKLVKK